MAKRQRRDDLLGHPPRSISSDQESRPGADPSDTTHEPSRLATLTEFHHQVEMLPDDERRVFELRYYGDFSQAEIAADPADAPQTGEPALAGGDGTACQMAGRI